MSESCNDIMERLIENGLELNEKSKKEIEQARQEIEEGRYVTHKDLKREMGL